MTKKSPICLKREYLSMSQDKLAYKSGVLPQTVRNYEKKQRASKAILNACKIYESLDCPPLPEDFKRMFFLN